MVVVGGICSPNHYSSCCRRWAHRTVRWCTGHGTVHYLVRATSADRWGLEQLTVEVLCPLVAPNSPVRSDFAVLTSDFYSVHCTVVSVIDRWAQLTVAPLAHRTVWCTLDSPVNFRGVALRKTRERPVREVPRPGHRIVSGAPLAAPILVLLQTL
jgi:hypothetical protein